MNPDTNKCPNCGAEFATLTDRTTFTCGTNRHPDGSHSRTDLCREREENTKLRELLHCAAVDLQHSDDAVRAQAQRALYDFLEKGTRLAPAPEEPTVVNLEPSNLFVDQKQQNMSDNEWRELGPNEVIQEGDEIWSLGMWIPVSPNMVIPLNEKMNPITRYRTRRPLPKREAKPIDNEIVRLKEMIKEAAKRGDEMAAHWKKRAEKAEAIIKQLHHFSEIIEGLQNTDK